MKVLVTGATGFVGRGVLPALSHLSVSVALWKEEERSLLPPGVPGIVVGSIGPNTDWKDRLKGFDAVLHMAGRAHVLKETESDPLQIYREINRDGTIHLARESVAQGVGRLVFISSIGVHGRGQGLGYTGPGYAPGMATEPEDDYAVSKLEAEQLLATMEGLEAVMVRPPLVAGPNAPGNLNSLMNLVWRGMPLPFGGLKNRRSLVGLGNLASFLAACLTHPNAAGKTFTVADKEILSTTEIIRRLAEGMGRSARLFPIPVGAAGALARAAGKRKTFESLYGSLVVDASLAARELGWSPPFPASEGLVQAGRAFAEARR